MVKELVKPTPAQVRWQNAEFGMFVHFGINTFNNREWSDGTKSPKTFNPKRLNTDQWIQVAKNAGVNYMILTCKHHDGFCLWQTETTDYSVKSSPYKQGKGDVVDEFVASCRKFGMKFGFYLSPWDRHEPCYKDKEAYDKFYAKQLNELLTKYAEHDELFEIWFDGAGSAGREYDWKSIIEICKQHRKSLFSVDQLVEIYEKSIGYGANLLLNLAPTDQGVFSEIDVRRLNQFVNKIRSMYGTPIATTSGTGTELELHLPIKQKIDAVELREDISQGQRIKAYELYYNAEGSWRPLRSVSKNLTVGHRKIDRLAESVVTDTVKVVVKEIFAEPIISKFCAYKFS